MSKCADEQGLKKALGDFMKGLDFKSVAPDGAVSEEEEEEEDEDAEEEDGSDVSSFDSGDEEEEDDEDEEEPEPLVAAPVKAKAEKPKDKPVVVQPEVDNFGAKVSLSAETFTRTLTQ
jgi:ribosome biogenesis protein MAK21